MAARVFLAISLLQAVYGLQYDVPVGVAQRDFYLALGGDVADHQSALNLMRASKMSTYRAFNVTVNMTDPLFKTVLDRACLHFMQLNSQQVLHFESSTARRARNTTGRARRQKRAWGLPARTFPSPIQYVLDAALPADVRNDIQAALALIESHTCIEWEESLYDYRATQVIFDYTVYSTLGVFGMCRAPLGKQTDGTHIVTFGPLCQSSRDILRLIFNLLGVINEVQSPMRDDFVDINWDSITPALLPEFDMVTDTQVRNYGPPFDTNSIMAFDKFYAQDWTILGPSQPIVPKLKGYTRMGQADQPSHWDWAALNQMYCAGVCSAGSAVCQNGGYASPRACGRCVCPPGLGGKKCAGGAGPEQGECPPIVPFSIKGSSRLPLPNVTITTGMRHRITAQQGACLFSSEDLVGLGGYPRGARCSLLLDTVPGCRLRITKVRPFSLAGCEPCAHYVEFRDGDLGLETERRCCPSQLTSEWYSARSHVLFILDSTAAFPYSQPPQQGVFVCFAQDCPTATCSSAGAWSATCTTKNETDPETEPECGSLVRAFTCSAGPELCWQQYELFPCKAYSPVFEAMFCSGPGVRPGDAGAGPVVTGPRQACTCGQDCGRQKRYLTVTVPIPSL